MFALLDAFLASPRPAEPNRLLKGRVLVGTAFCAIVAMISIIAMQSALGVEGFLIEHLYFLSMSFGCLAIVRFTSQIEKACSLMLFSILTYFTWGCYLSGGISSYLVPGLLVFPLTSAMLASHRQGGVWTAIGFGVLVFFGVVQPENTLNIDESSQHILDTLGFLLGAGAIGVLALIYESAKNTGFSLLRERREEAEKLANRISELLISINQSLNVIRSDSNDISFHSQSTAAGMKEQSEHANSVAEGMAELRQRTIRNYEDAKRVADSASGAGEQASVSANIMSVTNANMQKVSATVTLAAKQIQELTQRSDEITSIVGVIQAVAEQTNLLALNAAIEAARAGEHGRGFAVVADEVRQLAERTHRSSGEISTQIGNILDVTQQAMASMEEVTELVTTGLENSEKADAAMQALRSNSNEVSEFLGELSQSSKQQNEMNEAMTDQFDLIRQAIEKAHQATSDIAGTIQSLEREISTLSDLAGSFASEETQLF
ncbi:methyl-accepting chemotaxis protein [uncultured Thalassolituus sp.]|uniref:methyl-accepting chemotaxis protein n=1 Tax=uncultured Thalassolituus sp. TaxID=285273 RepID=UPI00262E37ED|nr:methyl-accepting chemotaxis protein [uncultured Thalassolituus sp.]